MAWYRCTGGNGSGPGPTPVETVKVADWDFKESLVDSVNGYTATLMGGASRDSNGVKIVGDGQYLKFPFGIFGFPMTFEMKMGTMDKQFGTGRHGRFFIFGSGETSGDKGFVYKHQDSYWSFYDTAWATSSTITDPNYFSNSTVKLEFDNEGHWKMYKDGVLLYLPSQTSVISAPRYLSIGSPSYQSFYNMTIESLKVYVGGTSNGE